jgi:hypothetical protein
MAGLGWLATMAESAFDACNQINEHFCIGHSSCYVALGLVAAGIITLLAVGVES